MKLKSLSLFSALLCCMLVAFGGIIVSESLADSCPDPSSGNCDINGKLTVADTDLTYLIDMSLEQTNPTYPTTGMYFSLIRSGSSNQSNDTVGLNFQLTNRGTGDISGTLISNMASMDFEGAGANTVTSSPTNYSARWRGFGGVWDIASPASNYKSTGIGVVQSGAALNFYDFRHIWVMDSPAGSFGTGDTQTGLWIDKQSRASANPNNGVDYGIVLDGNGDGADIVFGDAQETRLYRDEVTGSLTTNSDFTTDGNITLGGNQLTPTMTMDGKTRDCTITWNDAAAGDGGIVEYGCKIAATFADGGTPSKSIGYLQHATAATFRSQALDGQSLVSTYGFSDRELVDNDSCQVSWNFGIVGELYTRGEGACNMPLDGITGTYTVSGGVWGRSLIVGSETKTLNRTTGVLGSVINGGQPDPEVGEGTTINYASAFWASPLKNYGIVDNYAGVWIEQSSLATNSYGIVLDGDGAGSDIVFGADDSGSRPRIFSDNGYLKAQDVRGNITQFSPHDPETGEWVFYSKNVKTGRTVRVNMEELVRDMEKLTGKKYMIESFVNDKQ